ncbi:MAG: cytochrome c biogenesis protein CcsA [Proteobacteria bacterium]|nr:cytochrome c biogenesis protein CcsA [Pseudomonadota bacterium]
MTVSVLAAILAYFAAAGWLLVRAARGEKAYFLPRWPALVFAAAGVLLHAIALNTAIRTPAGLDLGMVNMFSLMAWQIGLLTFAGSLRPGTANLGIGLYPLVGISALALLFDGSPVAIVRNASWQLEAHILLSVLAYGLLALAAFQSILLAIQDYRLRRHRPGGWLRALPPLAGMEALLFQTLGLGFALLSLALFSGLIFVENLFAQHLVHKTVLSIVAWIVFGVLLWGRWRFGWRGRTAIRWTLGGFTLLVLAYFGSKLVLEWIKGIHWG